jgi:hypothetical protein
VTFEDGSSEEVDTILFATGFRLDLVPVGLPEGRMQGSAVILSSAAFPRVLCSEGG